MSTKLIESPRKTRCLSRTKKAIFLIVVSSSRLRKKFQRFFCINRLWFNIDRYKLLRNVYPRRRLFDLESFYLFLKITHSVLSSFCWRLLWTRSLINWKTEYISGARLLPINKETCIHLVHTYTYSHIVTCSLLYVYLHYFIVGLCWSQPMRKTVVFKWDLDGGYCM